MSALHEQASNNILTFLNEKRLIQNSWHTNKEGREYACLLGAAAGIDSLKKCPAKLMPTWLANCTVTLFDGLSAKDAADGIVRRYATLIGKWDILTDKQWNNILAKWLVRLIDQAIDSVPVSAKTQSYWPAIAKACEQCKTAISRQYKAATRAATRAADSADAAAARATADAAATRAAATRAATRAAYAARAAARAARSAAYATVNAADAAVANAAAYKKLFNALLDEIEKEIEG